MEVRREGIGKRGKAFVQMWTKEHIECAPGLLTRGTEERGIHLWALPFTPSNWDVNSFSLLVCMCVSAAWFPKLSNNTNTAKPERQKREQSREPEQWCSWMSCFAVTPAGAWLLQQWVEYKVGQKDDEGGAHGLSSRVCQVKQKRGDYPIMGKSILERRGSF